MDAKTVTDHLPLAWGSLSLIFFVGGGVNCLVVQGNPVNTDTRGHAIVSVLSEKTSGTHVKKDIKTKEDRFTRKCCLIS